MAYKLPPEIARVEPKWVSYTEIVSTYPSVTFLDTFPKSEPIESIFTASFPPKETATTGKASRFIKDGSLPTGAYKNGYKIL